MPRKKKSATNSDANTAKKAGRPRIELDKKLFEMLAEAGCSIDEISAMLKRSGLKIDRRTIMRRLQEPDYREAWDQGRLVMKALLRSQMWRLARLSAHPHVANQMSQFLARHVLGMSEKSALELSGRVDSAVEHSSASERNTRKIDDIAERINRRIDGIAAAAGAEKATSGAK